MPATSRNRRAHALASDARVAGVSENLSQLSVSESDRPVIDSPFAAPGTFARTAVAAASAIISDGVHIPFSQNNPDILPIDFSPYLRSIDRVLDELSYLPVPDQLSQLDDIMALIQGAMVDIYERCMESRVPQTLFSAVQTIVRISKRICLIQDMDVQAELLVWGAGATPAEYVAGCLLGLMAILQVAGGSRAAREKGLDVEIRELIELYGKVDQAAGMAFFECYQLVMDGQLPSVP